MSKGTKSSFIDTLLSANEKQFGKNVIVGTDRRIVGIEPYSLAFQYLIDLEVFPLQSIVVIAGEPKSYKTTAMLEIQKMAMSLDPVPGVGVVINTEGKWSHSKAGSVLGACGENLIVIPAPSIEKWQEAATHTLKTMKDHVEKLNTIREKKRLTAEEKALLEMPVPPMIVGVDSLVGSQSESIKEEVMKEGHGKKTFQDRAMLNAQWFATWTSDIVGIPASVVVTNHLRDKIDNTGGMSIKITSGGVSTTFMCSLEIRTKRIGEISKAAYEGAKLRWTTYFSSLGRDKRSIDINLIETYDSSGRQVTYFDWDEALLNLLVEGGTSKSGLQSGGVFGEALQELFGGKIKSSAVTGVGKVYSCEAMGISTAKAKEELITAQVMGRILQDPNGPWREKLKKAMRIQPAEVWTPDTVL